jgi:hypothetical protein
MLHKRALDYLLQFFQDIGLGSPQDFMRSSHNFHYAMASNPHLTVARGVSQFDPAAHSVRAENLTFLPATIHGL